LQVGEAIVSYADENSISLIAIATHGRSGLGRLVFGRVADFVLREAGLPILVIKPKKSGA
jgi:nucleotide-binding universal stress UspA family protein